MISKIENIVCIGEGLDPSEIHVKDRYNEIKEVRQIIMYFARKMTNKSWKLIAGYFNLDHSTGMHSFKTIQNLIDTDRQFRERMIRHENRLKAIKIDKMVNIANDTFKPLEFEVMKLEKKIFDLREAIEEIRECMKFIN